MLRRTSVGPTNTLTGEILNPRILSHPRRSARRSVSRVSHRRRRVNAQQDTGWFLWLATVLLLAAAIVI